MGDMILPTRPIQVDTPPSEGQMHQALPTDHIAATAQRPQYPSDFSPESTFMGSDPATATAGGGDHVR